MTICSNNKIVKRQLESVLLTQPWKGYQKTIDNFDKDFESALTSLVLANEYPQSLLYLSQGAIDIINKHKDILPDVMKKVQFALVNIITSTLLSRQNKRNLCYGPILVTGVLRNFHCNF